MSWVAAKLSDVAKIERNGVDPTSIEPGTSYLGLEHIESGGRILGAQSVTNGELASTKFRFSSEHILYGKLRPYLAKIALPDFDGICSTDILPVKPGPKIDKRYLAYFLRQPSMVDYANGRSSGANLPRLSPKALADFDIPLPPLEEQKRIAAILDQADSLHRLHQRAIDRLNALGQAIFHEMFGDPIDAPNQNLDWQAEPLDESIRFIDYRGKTPPKTETGIPLITAKNVKMGYINREPQEYIDENAFDAWMNRGFPRKGDILFTTEAPLGNVAELNTDEKLVVGQRLLTLQPLETKIDPIYLMYFLMSQGFRKLMFENSTGSTVVGIKSKLLKKIPIAYPDISDQVRFRERAVQVKRLQKHAEEHATSMDKLFRSLQHSAFRGEL